MVKMVKMVENGAFFENDAFFLKMGHFSFLIQNLFRSF